MPIKLENPVQSEKLCAPWSNFWDRWLAAQMRAQLGQQGSPTLKRGCEKQQPPNLKGIPWNWCKTVNQKEASSKSHRQRPVIGFLGAKKRLTSPRSHFGAVGNKRPEDYGLEKQALAGSPFSEAHFGVASNCARRLGQMAMGGRDADCARSAGALSRSWSVLQPPVMGVSHFLGNG